MYQHFGMPGIVAVAVAFVIAFAVLFASIAVIKFVVERAQARNQGKTNIAFVLSQAFTTARIANIMAIVVLGLAASYFLNLLQMPFFLWLAGFYMLMLFAETYWLVRTLKSSTPSQD
jgi:4-hydroxybenzoate polyprenyltransferase